MNIDLIHLSRPCSTIFPSPILSSIGFTVSFFVWDHIYFPAKGYLQIVADSAQTEYCSNFHFPYVRQHDISHFSNIYIGINAIRYIRKSIKPYIYLQKPIHPGYTFQTRAPHTTPHYQQSSF